MISGSTSRGSRGGRGRGGGPSGGGGGREKATTTTSRANITIPNDTQETIQNIKEITGTHSDEEVYAMLKECSMDPNETAQKLLLQDTFHEVKRKRDKRKENVSNKDSVDSNWRPGIQGHGGRSVRGNSSSRYLSHDAGGAKNPPTVNKESLARQGPENVKKSMIQNVENKSSPLMSNSISNGPTKQAHVVSPQTTILQTTASYSGITFTKEKVTVETAKFQSSTSPKNINIKNTASVSNPVVDSTLEFVIADLRNQKIDVEPTNETPDTGGLNTHHHHEKLLGKFQGYGSNDYSEESQEPIYSSTCTSGRRPSSNYGNQQQQLFGSQKVVPVKEWKPKQTNTDSVQTFDKIGPSDVQSASSNQASSEETTTSVLQKKRGESKLSDHVIFPTHIQVPKSERTVLNFGSFTGNFYVPPSCFVNESEDKNNIDAPLSSESSQDLEENIEEPSSSIENDSPVAQDGDYSVHPRSPEHIPENPSSGHSGAVAEASNISPIQEYNQPQRETFLSPEGSQYTAIQGVYGLIPPMVRNSFTAFENSEPQASHNTSRLPGFVVQQPFDPSANYYPQIYHPATDGDGRYSPFHSTGPTTNHSAALSSPADQSQQESGDSPNQHTSVTAPVIVTQSPPALIQTTIPIPQQPVPIFRQATGVHVSPYPSNYIPYPYFSPFFLPPHPFISNAAFPQQHPTPPIYPSVATAATGPVKYPVSQFKTGTSSTHSVHIGMPPGYGQYNPSSSATTTVNLASSHEELTGSQYKESNLYLPGQQQQASEATTVWIPSPVPGHDIPGLQQPSFYNLPQGQQHLPFTTTPTTNPNQLSPHHHHHHHSAFPGIFHPSQIPSAASVHPILQHSQSVAGGAEIVGGPQPGGGGGGVYPPQQPQHPPLNWSANNY